MPRGVPERNQHMKLDYQTNQVLIGGIMGDGAIVKRHVTSRNYYYCEMHSIKQRDYLIWKSVELEQLRPSISVTRNGKLIVLCTLSAPFLTDIRRKVYTTDEKTQRGKKTNFTSLIPFIDKQALAVLYCDDGWYEYRSYGLGISTNSWDRDSLDAFVEMLKQKWDIKSCVSFKGIYPNIMIYGASVREFIQLIYPHFPVDVGLNYKLGRWYPGNQSLHQAVMVVKRKWAKDYYRRNSKKIKAINYRWRTRRRQETGRW